MKRFYSDRLGADQWFIALILAVGLILCVLPLFSPARADEVTYPKDYTHRPLLEFFTSLSCAPCMDNAHPAVHEVLDDADDIDGEPFEMVVFHQNIPGSDDLTTAESTERYAHYKDDVREGVPNMIFDGGYNELNPNDPADIWGEIDASGGRDVKKATLWVKYEIVDDTLHYSIKVNNVGTSSISGSLYLFVIENGVWAYSSHLDKNVSSDHVFRGYAMEDERQTIDANGWFNTSDSWEIDQDATVPINPDNLSVVAALFDTSDHDVRPPPNGNYVNLLTFRSIQSATPETTEYDGGFPETPSKITFTSLAHNPDKPTPSDTVTITAAIQSEYDLVSVSLKYCVDDSCYDTDMTLSGTDYSADIGPFSDGEEISYEVAAEDEMGVIIYSEELSFMVKEEPGDDDDDDDEPDGSLKISDVSVEPEEPDAGSSIKVSAVIKSDHDISKVTVYYWTEGEDARSKSMLKRGGGRYDATLGRFEEGITLYYNITASDDGGNRETTKEYSVSIPISDEPEVDEETPGFILLELFVVVLGAVLLFIWKRR